MAEAETDAPSGLGKTRLEAFSDGIFAVALTVLVVEIKVDTVDLSHSGWWEHLWPQVAGYILTFVMVGTYWVAHHNELRLIQRTNRWFIWLNLLFLLPVACIPLTTGLLIKHLNSPAPVEIIAARLYGGNLVLVGAFLTLLWWYAVSKHPLHHGSNCCRPLVADTVLPWERNETFERNVFLPGCYLIFTLLISTSRVPVMTGLLLFALAPLIYIAWPEMEYRWMYKRNYCEDFERWKDLFCEEYAGDSSDEKALNAARKQFLSDEASKRNAIANPDRPAGKAALDTFNCMKDERLIAFLRDYNSGHPEHNLCIYSYSEWREMIRSPEWRESERSKLQELEKLKMRLKSD
jgi:uncharacterized membrane protein